MTAGPVFSPRLLAGWIAAATIVFAISLYFMGGGGDFRSPDSVGPSTFSRSAIGHAGLAEILQGLKISVIKSQYNSLEQVKAGSLLVIAEPRPSSQSEETIRTLLKADRILLVLPKWAGRASEHTPGWLGEARLRSPTDAQWALRLVAARAEVVRQDDDIKWTTNPFSVTPRPVGPIQLMRGAGLRAIVGGADGMLVGEIVERDRRILVLSDPDVIANHGLQREPNPAFAIEVINRLRGPNGAVVFDETVHGLVARPESPFALMFRFPFVIATAQAVIALMLLMWASLARFGAPLSMQPPLSAGRHGLLLNIAQLIEFTGHQPTMIQRYVIATIRDVAHQLHAPAGLVGESLLAWLQRVGGARRVDVDCAEVVRRAGELGDRRRRDLAPLVRIARDIHRWKREIIDGPARNPHDH
jgi:hypothetical protein